jgi:hypothetical protein
MSRLLADVRLTPEGVRDVVLGRLEHPRDDEDVRHAPTQGRHRAR